MVERNEMVEQILSRVMEKLAAAGETVTETELMQSLAFSCCRTASGSAGSDAGAWHRLS